MQGKKPKDSAERFCLTSTSESRTWRIFVKFFSIDQIRTLPENPSLALKRTGALRGQFDKKAG